MWNFDCYNSNTAIITEAGDRISYEMLKQDAENLYRAIGRRCLVFSLCKLEYGSVLGYVSFLGNGIVPVLLDARMDRTLLWSLIQLYRPDYLWIPQEFKEEFCEKSGYGHVTGIHSFCLIHTPFFNEYPLYEELALLLTTSGSTGSPKFVRQSYENLISNTESIVEYLEIGHNERAITTLPMSYTYGLSIINTHLYTGASIVLTEKNVMQDDFWEQLSSHQATSFAGVPYTYEMLEKLRFFQMNLPHLKTMTQAGGKLAPELHKKFAEYAMEHHKRFVVMYGATEATARMGYLPPERSLEKYGSIGIAIPGGSFSLIGDHEEIIDEPDKTGELLYQGANVTLGYAECGEDLIKGDERHGVYKTGDMAKRDEDGFYYITGRKKRFLKMFGSRVSLDECERMIQAEYPVECACTGVDNQMMVYVAGQAELSEIKQFISKKTQINQGAFRILRIESLPRNETGKILYSKLASAY